MLSLAESDVPIAVDDLDRNPWLLNCANGTLDLRTGQLREARREDAITKLCPTPFDPHAGAEQWERFLQDIYDGDEELIAFVWRLLGYCLTGETREHVLPILYGSGANGKSTLVETVSRVLGPDFASAAPRNLLMTKQGESHPTELADLHGRRLVIASETDAGRQLAEATVKQLTGRRHRQSTTDEGGFLAVRAHPQDDSLHEP